MVLDTVGNLLFLSVMGIAVGTATGLVCAPVLLSERARRLGRHLGPTPSLPSNYVLLACLLGIPVVLLQVVGTQFLVDSEQMIHEGVRQTVRSHLRINYGLLLYVVALARLGTTDEPLRDFDPLDALALLAWAVGYSIVAVGVLAVL